MKLLSFADLYKWQKKQVFLEPLLFNKVREEEEGSFKRIVIV